MLLTWCPHTINHGDSICILYLYYQTRWLGCLSIAEHHTAEQYSKTGRRKPRKDRLRSNLSWNTRRTSQRYNAFNWEAVLEAERHCFSKVKLRSLDSFSTVQPIVNGGDWGFIELYSETIIVIVLLTLNLSPKGHTTHHLCRGHGSGTLLINSNAWGWHSS